MDVCCVGILGRQLVSWDDGVADLARYCSGFLEPASGVLGAIRSMYYIRCDRNDHFHSCRRWISCRGFPSNDWQYSFSEDVVLFAASVYLAEQES